MIPALIAQIALIFLLFLGPAGAQTMDEAVQALSRKVAARVPAGTGIRLTSRNLSTLPAADAARAQAQLDRLLRRRVARQAPLAEVRLTVSESVGSLLLVAEITRENTRFVELAPFRVEAPARPVLPALERRLLWEQEAQILDAVAVGERLFVLDARRLQVLERGDGMWRPVSQAAIEAPVVRDPRGRLEVSGEIVNAFLPGLWCQGAFQPVLSLNCENRPAEFALDNLKWHFSAGRNTLESPGWPAVYSFAQARGGMVAAETDGVARVYDAERRPLGTVEDWGSDLAGVCDGRVLAVRGASRDGLESVALFSLVDGKAVEASEPLELPGTVTAVWPAKDGAAPTNGGAVVVARNAQTGRYAAYSVTANCGR